MNELYSRTQLKPEMQGDQVLVVTASDDVYVADSFPLTIRLSEFFEQLLKRRKEISVERVYSGVSKEAAETFTSLMGNDPVYLSSLDQMLVQEEYIRWEVK